MDDCEIDGSNCTVHSGSGSDDDELLKLVQKWSSSSQGNTTISS